ncbi:MAG: flagellar biosynthesis anti-sigma factor FlgM [Gammaproteobacteria bacterium]|nr:flagellar biosynthesis anti-sigma factor FlgM [Gammaproteobacteria bacterium]
MSVEFNGFSSNKLNTQRNARAETQAPARPQPQPSAESDKAVQAGMRGDNVSLSSQVKGLKQMEERLRDQPEVDDSRVENIRKALSDGSFKIDAEKLAQKMLEFDKGIFG